MPKVDLQKRIEQSVYKSRRRHWYSRWWGILLIVFGLFFIFTVVMFGALTNFYYQKIASGELYTRALTDLEQEARVDLLHNGSDPRVGPATAPVVIVAFEDFECPFCLQAQPFLKRLLTTYSGDVQFIYKDFPLTVIHPNAMTAAEAAQCAFEQGKFWEFHDELFDNQDRLAEAYYRTVAQKVGLNINEYNECYASGKYRRQINDDLELGRVLGVVGTPTFFINGELFSQGYSPEIDQSFQEAIEYIRAL